MKIRLGLGASLLALAFAVTAFANSPGSWEMIDEEDGIRTWKKDTPGMDLPGFRGQVVINAPPAQVFSVMQDRNSHTKWMHRCAESKLLKTVNESRQILYNRTDAPWPVWDRDVILDTTSTKSADGKSIDVVFSNISSDLKPLPSKVVRMPRLVGFYKLRQLDANKTQVTYQIDADIGGSIPAWLAKRSSKELPYETLSKLRDRVEGKI